MSPAAGSLKTRPENKYVKAKRALRSLAISVAIPICLSLFSIFFFGSGRHFPRTARPAWVAPLWLIHSAAIGSAFVMGLAGWLVWADGGFRLDSDALPLYMSHLSLLLVWDPLVLRIRSAVAGFLFSCVDLGVLFGCYWNFKKVNPFAKDLVKPCIVWRAYLTAVTYMLIYL